MKPERGSEFINVPISFDGGVSGRSTDKGKGLWLFFVISFWVFTSVIAMIIGNGFFGKMSYPFFSFIVMVYIIRYLIIREHYYRKKRREVQGNDYVFGYDVFWNIHEISNTYPYVASYANGTKAVFIAFDKGVVVGKAETYNYDHHEAISEAYRQMAKRNIECMHIDFMDTVGKDSRLNNLFNIASRVENKDLQRVIMRKYDHIEASMNRVYTTYDVYCFYFYGREDMFWDNLQAVLQYFNKANYIRYRVLNKDAIGDLASSLFGVEDFSVGRTTEFLFKKLNLTKFIRPIWVEKNGQRTVLNKTTSEVAEAKRINEAEKAVKKRKKGAKLGKKGKDQEINIFD